MADIKLTLVVACALVDADKRVLLAQRPAGKALAAVNLAFFLGTALMQSVTGAVAAFAGLPAVLLFMAAMLLVGVMIFLTYTSATS